MWKMKKIMYKQFAVKNNITCVCCVVLYCTHLTIQAITYSAKSGTPVQWTGVPLSNLVVRKSRPVAKWRTGSAGCYYDVCR